MEKEKGGKKGKKVIFSITKDLSRFLIPHREGKNDQQHQGMKKFKKNYRCLENNNNKIFKM